MRSVLSRQTLFFLPAPGGARLAAGIRPVSLRCWEWGLAFWSVKKNIWATVWCRNLYCSWRRKRGQQEGKTKE